MKPKDMKLINLMCLVTANAKVELFDLQGNKLDVRTDNLTEEYGNCRIVTLDVKKSTLKIMLDYDKSVKENNL